MLRTFPMDDLELQTVHLGSIASQGDMLQVDIRSSLRDGRINTIFPNGSIHSGAIPPLLC